MTSSDAPATDKRDFVTRYFLRRLAIARHRVPTRKLGTQYTDALLETILIFVGLPMLGIASLILIPSLRWAPNTIAKWFGYSPWSGVIFIGILSVAVGRVWIGKRFEKYREDRLYAICKREGLSDCRLAEIHRIRCMRDRLAVYCNVHHVWQPGNYESV